MAGLEVQGLSEEDGKALQRDFTNPVLMDLVSRLGLEPRTL